MKIHPGNGFLMWFHWKPGSYLTKNFGEHRILWDFLKPFGVGQLAQNGICLKQIHQLVKFGTFNGVKWLNKLWNQQIQEKHLLFLQQSWTCTWLLNQLLKTISNKIQRESLVQFGCSNIFQNTNGTFIMLILTWHQIPWLNSSMKMQNLVEIWIKFLSLMKWWCHFMGGGLIDNMLKENHIIQVVSHINY